MSAGHVPVTAHDAEEQMKPYLLRVFDAMEALNTPDDIPEYARALRQALSKALDLLGVQQ